ncbi:fibronectin type III domain-containing protein [Flagellimonas sp.]|uniref:fibronectin type III domain-containing protein n=1 Tax=Flagellimonas sp. TaxID=2058762 RepID=UPI003BB161CA
MKHTLFFGALIALLFNPISFFAQNLIEADLSQWVSGQSGGTTSFNEFGGHNERITVNGPFGNQVTVWSAESTATSSGSGQSGGWIHSGLDLNTSKTYRISYWMRSTGSTSCLNNAGVYSVPLSGGSNVSLLRIESNMAAFTWPTIYNAELTTDKWFLIIGYIYAKDATTYNFTSGVYDPATFDSSSGNLPTPVATTYNYKFPSSHEELDVRLRNDLWNCQVGEIQYSYSPRIEEVNGSEPTIQDLLGNNNPLDTQAPSVPTGLQSTAQSQTTVDLSWNSSTDDVGVTNYRVYKDGVLDGNSGNLTTYQATGLTSGIAYDFTVSAMDAAENESAQSTSISVTTENGSSGGGSTVWTKSGSTASYSGEVAIGTSTVPSGYQLAVDGDIRTREIRVDQDNWPDYVFDEDYDLPTLEEIKSFIEANGHLPNLPSAEEVTQNGTDLGKMDRLLLEKIEQLTLFAIQQNRLLEKQQEELNQLRAALKSKR